MNAGYLILGHVCTPEQQVAEAQLEFVRAKHRVHALEPVLAEAKALGLIKVAAETELVPA